jgi:hypothetical protein
MKFFFESSAKFNLVNSIPLRRSTADAVHRDAFVFEQVRKVLRGASSLAGQIDEFVAYFAIPNWIDYVVDTFDDQDAVITLDFDLCVAKYSGEVGNLPFEVVEFTNNRIKDTRDSRPSE